MEYHDFINTLKKRVWQFQARSFYRLFEAIKFDRQIERLIGKDPYFAEAYQREMVVAIHDQYVRPALEKSRKDQQLRLELYRTGDKNFDDFVDMVHAHDFYYAYSDDNRVWRAGSESEKRIKDIIKNSDKKYGVFWIYFCETMNRQSNDYIAEQKAAKVV